MAPGLAAAGVSFVVSVYVWSLPALCDRVGSIRITAGQRYGGDKVSALTAPA